MVKFINKLLGRKQKEKYNKPLPLSSSAQPTTSTQPDSSSSKQKLAKPTDAAAEVQEAMLLRGLTDPADYKYRLSLALGDMLDVQDKQGRWRPAEITKASPTHLTVRFVDSGKQFDVQLHRGGARIARPFSRSDKAAGGAAGAKALNHTNTSASYATTAPSSPKSTVAALPGGHRPSHLSIEPNAISHNTILPPLTPWSPSTVDYSISSTCIVHHPPPPQLTPTTAGSMRVIHMAKDNSCLYHSIAFTCDSQKPRAGLHVMQQRLRAHSLVTADPSTYTAAILGCPVEEYCTKLCNLSTWGGAIELGLFSSLYEVEIFAFDFTMPTVYRFGDNNNYQKRVFLVYQGNHYEALAFVYEQDGRIQEYFNTTDDEALRRAQEVVEVMYVERQAKAGKAISGGKGKDGEVVWAGQGLYELKQKAKTLLRYLSPTQSKRSLLPPSTASSASASATSPPTAAATSSPPRPTPPSNVRSIPPPIALNTGLPRMNSVSIPTPLSSHARRSSFTFGITSTHHGRGSITSAPAFHSPPPLPAHPHSLPISTSPYPPPVPERTHHGRIGAPAAAMVGSASYAQLGAAGRAVSPSLGVPSRVGSPSLSGGSDGEQPGLPAAAVDKDGEEHKEDEYGRAAYPQQQQQQQQQSQPQHQQQQAGVVTLADSFKIL